jgi:predicted RNase H-like HicB family nuclease
MRLSEFIDRYVKRDPQWREVYVEAGALREAARVHAKARIRRGAWPSQLTVDIEREDEGFVATCPELDITSQGSNAEQARSNLVEAVEFFLQTADASEVKRRLHGTRS